MAKKYKITEAEVARVAVTELQRLGFDTYEEVSFGYAYKRADIVAVQGKWAFIVEVKAAFSLRLLEQARKWMLPVLLVVPSCRHDWICRELGFGLWTVYDGKVSEIVSSPRTWNRHAFEDIKRKLHDGQRSGQYARAGEPGGGYWSPFQQTAREFIELVKEHPGMTMKESVEKLNHHYLSDSTARKCLPSLIRRGIIKGIEVEDSRPIRLWPEGQCPNREETEKTED